ncbi:uncharacterized protein LOC106709726 [Papilio machaon]|uniref:uncharacterized protein LOC106709726 n=1 Tax=Papilio machaon TaxID=76193 RepID=UPI001E663E0A|nr:uncharacterized protein LOC106709726 [Papilio machaon]
MKTYTCVLLLAAMGAAEPPFSRQARPGLARQRADDAPYPAAGFRPATAFELPSREAVAPPSTSYGVPATSYGAPLATYAAPQTEYGPPVTDAGDETTEEVETIEGSENKDEKERLEEGPKGDAEVVSAEGAYYVLLQDGRLQRVQYRTENDVRNMAYTARLQYRAEERAPLFVYTAAPQYQPAAAYVQLL